MTETDRFLWEYDILSHLYFICDPKRFTLPRGHTLGAFLISLGMMMQAVESINAYLSEYQYLNPLF